jgi:CHAT domain-containing protein
VSLWPVDDRATALLMTGFYEEYVAAVRRGADRPKAEALRLAKLRLLHLQDAEGRRPFRHPAYWAGFVLLGDAGG